MIRHTFSLECVCNVLGIMTYAILGSLLSNDCAICLLTSLILMLIDSTTMGFLSAILETFYTFSNFHFTQPLISASMV